VLDGVMQHRPNTQLSSRTREGKKRLKTKEVCVSSLASSTNQNTPHDSATNNMLTESTTKAKKKKQGSLRTRAERILGRICKIEQTILIVVVIGVNRAHCCTKERQREKDRERDRERETQRERQTETNRDREGDKGSSSGMCDITGEH
jgi:hypothetical protein